MNNLKTAKEQDQGSAMTPAIVRSFNKATVSGSETSGVVNQWTYLSNGGPVVAGERLDFVELAV